MNSLATDRAAVTNPPGSPRRSRIRAVRPAATWAARSSRTVAAAVSEKSCSRTYPTAPSPRTLEVTSRRWTMSRVTARSNGAAVPRWSRRVTTEPFGPRTRSRAASMVRPSSALPSVARMRSPARIPAFSAGEPSMAPTTRREQVGPSVAHPCVPSLPCVAISAPTPSNCPLIPRRLSRYSCAGQVRGIRIPEGADHPLDRALDEGLAFDLATRVAVADRVVGVPEGPEGLGVRDRRRGFGRGPLPERVAGQEETAAGEDRDDRDRHREHDRVA